MKSQILQIIYDAFETWSAKEEWACKKGCATCCTQNVTITALEGEHILRYIIQENKEQWLVDKLNLPNSPQRPKQTINQFGADCMAGKEPEPEAAPSYSTCPFLEDAICAIYPARPFSCRCFLSLHTCSPNRAAVVSEKYVAASTAISQLTEHLGQREYWGNMLDVLVALLDISAYKSVADKLGDTTRIIGARANVLNGQPLPGFMLGEEDYAYVAPLLEEIFNKRIADKTVEDILNGK